MFQSTDGDVAECVRGIVKSQEFVDKFVTPNKTAHPVDILYDRVLWRKADAGATEQKLFRIVTAIVFLIGGQKYWAGEMDALEVKAPGTGLHRVIDSLINSHEFKRNVLPVIISGTIPVASPPKTESKLALLKSCVC